MASGLAARIGITALLYLRGLILHLHILGICGTFMGSLALIAKSLGHQVTGSDANVYPPMSTQLEEQGIALCQGYSEEHLRPHPDLVVIGNAMARGNAAVEYVLDIGLPYASGPQWLADNVLKDRWVLGVAGTHGKTTTSSMLAWIMDYAGLNPGYLIGGVPKNFGLSARLGGEPFFVVEADEYDSAFFDKRSKFIHYRPRTVVLNNLEFDHADIFDDIGDIQKQFHHLVRTIPRLGLVVLPKSDPNLKLVIDKGCWTPLEYLLEAGSEDRAGGWAAQLLRDDASEFEVFWKGKSQGTLGWSQYGVHNLNNALAAIAAARHVGVTTSLAIEALAKFEGVARRMENLGKVDGVTLYDDFAHHPTAIETTLQGLRARVGSERIVAIIEPRSNTMKSGVHGDQLALSVKAADEVIWFKPEGLSWDMKVMENKSDNGSVQETVFCDSLEDIITHVVGTAKQGDHVLIMSNGGFGGLHQSLIERLQSR